MLNFKWINIFVRDLLLIFVVGAIQFWTNFESKTAFLITGMMIVWITWQLSDYITEIKILRGIEWHGKT